MSAILHLDLLKVIHSVIAGSITQINGALQQRLCKRSIQLTQSVSVLLFTATSMYQSLTCVVHANHTEAMTKPLQPIELLAVNGTVNKHLLFHACSLKKYLQNHIANKWPFISRFCINFSFRN